VSAVLQNTCGSAQSVLIDTPRKAPVGSTREISGGQQPKIPGGVMLSVSRRNDWETVNA
jgi:hypothetical protein